MTPEPEDASVSAGPDYPNEPVASTEPEPEPAAEHAPDDEGAGTTGTEEGEEES